METARPDSTADRSPRPSAGAAALVCLLGIAALAPVPGLATPSPTGGPGDPRGPSRIVSLVPAATEILFALGAGDRVVGRTRWDVYPAEARAVPDVGDGMHPSLEVLLARRPDLVVLFDGPANRPVRERLEALGVPTLALVHNTFGDLERTIAVLGDAVGCAAGAHALIRSVRARLDAVAQATSGLSRPAVYYDVWPDPPITIGRGTYLDSLVRIAGGQNVFGDLPGSAPRVGLEAIIRRDPDVIVRPVAEGERTPAPDERPGWNHIRAVAEGRVVTVDGDLLHRLGPRIGEAARELAAALHPAAPLPAPEPPARPGPCAG